jgi:hypothetical protein
MPLFSAFTPFGHFAFSSKPSHGESIYKTLRNNFGDVFGTDFDSNLEQARLYAQAMCLASSQYQLDRAANNRKPLTATELLGALERDYQVVPPPKATLHERRVYLAALQRISRGNRREAMEDALRTLLGSDFIEYRTTRRADIVATPGSVGVPGVFLGPGAKKKVFSIDVAISTVGFAFPLTVPITSLGGTDAPTVGEIYCVDPDPRRSIDQISIEGVGPGTITTRFTQPHEPGCLAVRPHPYWSSNQRVDTVVVTMAAATNTETRRKIDELMARAVRGVSTWQIIQGTTPGFFTSDDPVLGLPDINPVF